MSFKDMLNSNSIDDLVNKMEQSQNKRSYKDDRFWQPEVDKAGNGYAVIRFLPPVDGEDLPWAKVFSYAFHGPGGWYIENSPTTLNEKDPVAEMNTLLWHSGSEEDKKIASERSRKTQYISNILVVHDPANPQNEGKVFLYKYGKKIFDKISEAMKPAFADEKPINPFHFIQGANFKIKIRKVLGYRNYDKSEFEHPSPLFDGDERQLEATWNKQYPLKEFLDPSNFKSYAELKQRLDTVLGDDIRSTSKPKISTAEEHSPSDSSYSGSSDDSDTSPPFESTSQPTRDIGDSTNAMSYFEQLAKED